MVRYIGPRVKIIRRLGLLPGLTRKNPKSKTKTPGQHGKRLVKRAQSRSSLSDDYGMRLLEKQKLRFNYGVTEKQLVAYYREAKRKKGSTGNFLLELLEKRLDCIVFRLGFAPTIPAARQLVNHGHIQVNNRKVTIASFHCKKNDTISIQPKTKSERLIFSNFELQQQKRKLIERRMKRVNLIKSRFSSLLPKHLKINVGEGSFEKKIGDQVEQDNAARTIKSKQIEIEKNSNNSFLVGTILSEVKRREILVKVNELKVVEYYSR